MQYFQNLLCYEQTVLQSIPQEDGENISIIILLLSYFLMVGIQNYILSTYCFKQAPH